jgi:hypothetical protein
VLRGGPFTGQASDVRSAYRSGNVPVGRDTFDYLGMAGRGIIGGPKFRPGSDNRSPGKK